MEQLLKFTTNITQYHTPILMFIFDVFVTIVVLLAVVTFIYDKFIQRENQLLINYPLIGRMRYLFYLIRDPMRQYFGDEKFYESFDKVRWVYNSAEGKSAYASFSPAQPQNSARISIKNANCVLNTEDVSDEFSVTFGESCAYPFKTNSIMGRSAMSDGSISPEATRAFSKGAYLGGFPINTGEGGLTSNFLYTHGYNSLDSSYLEVLEGTAFAKSIYKIVRFFSNVAIAKRVYKKIVIDNPESASYLFDKEKLVCYRIKWSAPLSSFPKDVPSDIADIILQVGSGFYGVRDSDGNFNEERYQKSMRFAKMTEIKMAQGAKQTGGKLLASKVTPSVAYYRGVEPYKDLFSPNQFPYGKTLPELFDFIGRLKELSQKPVGVKIVISSTESFDEYANLIKTRVESGSNSYPDFITVDGAEGGSATAPIEMMMSVGMIITKALFIADRSLKRAGVRDRVKLIASEKVLTPDDALVLFGLGADYVAIARAFMLSAGCIRARECSGANGRHCPVGLATQDKKKRASFLIEKKAITVASYHKEMLHGIRNLLAVVGVNQISKLDHKHLIFKDHTGKTYMDIDKYFEASLVE